MVKVCPAPSLVTVNRAFFPHFDLQHVWNELEVPLGDGRSLYVRRPRPRLGFCA